MITCPRCKEKMDIKNKDGLEIDYCTFCGGILFDNYELTEAIDKNINDIDSGSPFVVDRIKIERSMYSKIKCPRCNKPMREFNYSYVDKKNAGQTGKIHDTDIVINSCLDCRTVWLDKGEFNAIKLARGLDFSIDTVKQEIHIDKSASKKQLCPNCKDINLESISRKGIQVDYCPKCFGIWFDQGELSHFFDNSLKEKKTISKGKDSTIDEKNRNCPNCNLPLSKHNYHMNILVLVDSCLKCKGIWLDRGEFNKIKEYIGKEVSIINNINNLDLISRNILK